MKNVVQSLLATIVAASACTAQIVVQPDADLWGGGVTNPSGLAAIPILQYDPANGEMWINTVGLNGVSDTTTWNMIGGDDVGFTSISVESPEAIETGPGFIGFVDGCVWNEQYFNFKQQLFVVTGGVHYLDPTEGMRVWTFDAGLTPDDFGNVEMAVNFASGLPGGTLFGSVQFVPEPSALASVLMALITGLAAVRNRRI